jgi:hypothetical protein
MGPYLTTPNKTKEVENGENDRVNILVHLSEIRSDLGHVVCKDGEIQWKILILLL